MTREKIKEESERLLVKHGWQLPLNNIAVENVIPAMIELYDFLLPEIEKEAFGFTKYIRDNHYSWLYYHSGEVRYYLPHQPNNTISEKELYQKFQLYQKEKEA